MIPRCANRRCHSPPVFRLAPYGLRRYTEHSCRRHLSVVALSLLARFPGPVMLYRIREVAPCPDPGQCPE